MKKYKWEYLEEIYNHIKNAEIKYYMDQQYLTDSEDAKLYGLWSDRDVIIKAMNDSASITTDIEVEYDKIPKLHEKYRKYI